MLTPACMDACAYCSFWNLETYKNTIMSEETIANFMARHAPNFPPPDILEAAQESHEHFEAHALEGALLDRESQSLATGRILLEESQEGFLTLWLSAPSDENHPPDPSSCMVRTWQRDRGYSDHTISEVLVGPKQIGRPHFLLRRQKPADATE